MTNHDTRDRRGPRRVLVTGSRDWTNATTIRDALAAQWGDGTAVLVSGACPAGADRIAEMFWTRWGGRVERHRADWHQHGRSAGFWRNAAMVELGADVCLAFIRNNSRGASHTAALAETAAIPTHRHQTPASPDRGPDRHQEDPMTIHHPGEQPGEHDTDRGPHCDGDPVRWVEGTDHDLAVHDLAGHGPVATGSTPTVEDRGAGDVDEAEAAAAPALGPGLAPWTDFYTDDEITAMGDALTRGDVAESWRRLQDHHTRARAAAATSAPVDQAGAEVTRDDNTSEPRSVDLEHAGRAVDRLQQRSDAESRCTVEDTRTDQSARWHTDDRAAEARAAGWDAPGHG